MRLLILTGVVTGLLAAETPAEASATRPEASDCLAAAEAGLAYWEKQSSKDPTRAEVEIPMAKSLIARVGPQSITAEQRRKYRDLIPDFRDVFVRRCLATYAE
ncbi:MAG: hypothetical protein ACKOPM_11245 [Novosphingobium sp.]